MMATERDHRVLVFAPIGRDAPAVARLLSGAGIEAAICRDLKALVEEIALGTGAVFLAEEGLFGKDIAPLAGWCKSQPAWSDLPFIVLTSHQDQPAVAEWRRNLLGTLSNVSLLERPIQPITLASAVRTALRARSRQYEVRALIEAREEAAQQLERLVIERTRALEDSNAQLRREMSERARVEESLRQAQKMEAIGRLTGGIAHDFNNVLMVISGGLEMIERQGDPVRRNHLLAGMRQAAQRAAVLTRQLLTYSRRQKLKPEVLDIAQQIGGMRELLDRSLGGDVHVAFEFADGAWPVEVDGGELELAVLNLAVNARDAMPNGGSVIVRSENVSSDPDGELKGPHVRLSVIDSGTGMTPEVVARAFEPFYTTKEVGKGSGLGLAQVYGFAKESGGTVRIQSEPGKGTTIAIYLPRSDKSPSRDVGEAQALPARPAQVPEAGRVLLVEDDDEVAALVSEMLDQLGYGVTRAATAKAALGALANGRPVDVVFSDIMMPGGMNGVELALEIRKRRAELPVLLTSGYAEGAAPVASKAGIRILAKPYHIEELSAALHAATSQGASGRRPQPVGVGA
jgi:signal transduction histidine kinase/CheY-like chemotaxis protein